MAGARISPAHHKGALKKDPSLQFFMAGRMVEHTRIAVAKGQRAVLYFGSYKNKAAATLNYLGSIVLIGVIRRRIKEGAWAFADFAPTYDGEKKKFPPPSDQPWILSGAAMQALRPLKIGRGVSYGVGVDKQALGIKSPTSRVSKRIPVRDYIYYGLRGSRGKHGRVQAPRDFLGPAVLELVSRNVPKMAKEAERLIAATWTRSMKDILSQAGERAYKHTEAVAESQAQMEQQLEKTVPGWNDMTDREKERIRSESGDTLHGDASGMVADAGAAGMGGASVEDDWVKWTTSLVKEYKEEYGITLTAQQQFDLMTNARKAEAKKKKT